MMAHLCLLVLIFVAGHTSLCVCVTVCAWLCVRAAIFDWKTEVPIILIYCKWVGGKLKKPPLED
jgi:hypothetical protein